MACVEKSRGTIGMSRSLFIAAILAGTSALTRAALAGVTAARASRLVSSRSHARWMGQSTNRSGLTRQTLCHQPSIQPSSMPHCMSVSDQPHRLPTRTHRPYAAVTAVTASTPTPLPTPAPTSEAVMMSVYTVQYGGFILTENGGAFAYGDGSYGRLGTGTSDTSGFTSPQRLDVNNIVQMDTSAQTGIVLTGAGEVHYWGEGLGTSTTSGSGSDYDLAEMPLSSFTETSAVRFVRAGGDTLAAAFWCAVFDDEYAVPECWGSNGYKELAQVRVARAHMWREVACNTVSAQVRCAKRQQKYNFTQLHPKTLRPRGARRPTRGTCQSRCRACRTATSPTSSSAATTSDAR